MQQKKPTPDYQQKILNGLAIYYEIETHVRAFSKFFGMRIAVEVLFHGAYILMYLFNFLISINSNDKEQTLMSSCIFTVLIFSVSLNGMSNASTMLGRETNGLLPVLELLLLESREQDGCL